MLQRIYGPVLPDTRRSGHISISSRKQKSGSRRLGKELDLFQVNEEAGPGLIIYHPNRSYAAAISLRIGKNGSIGKRGYDIGFGAANPQSRSVEEVGHFDHYRENMYFTEVGRAGLRIKPMNCLAHMLIYKSRIRSYRDLPLRFFELGTVHRNEKTGVLHGLLRVREFTQDDAHILCTLSSLNGEIKAVVDFVDYAMGVFGFAYEVELSTRPEKSIGRIRIGNWRNRHCGRLWTIRVWL